MGISISSKIFLKGPWGFPQDGPFEGFEKEARELESEELADKLFARFLVQHDAHKGSEKKLAAIVDSIPFLKSSESGSFGSTRLGIWWLWICYELANTSSSSQGTNSWPWEHAPSWKLGIRVLRCEATR